MWFTCFRFWPDGTLLTGAQVAAIDIPILRLRVNDPGLHVVDCRIKAVAAVNHLPVSFTMPSRVSVWLGPHQLPLSCKPPQMW